MTYPILVEKFTGKPSMTIVCERCHAEDVIDADDLLNEGLYECPRSHVVCVGTAVMKYEEADRCAGCGVLGFYDYAELKGCCSRRCMLQAEYAAGLNA
jgi:hypothetical protein